jgi:transcriptional regulator with XRE-family HTH domain
MMTTSTSITPSMQARIRELYAAGMSGRAIAEEMGINKSTTTKYLRGYRQPDGGRPLPTGRCYAKFGTTLEELAGSMLSDRIVAGILGLEVEDVREFRATRRGGRTKVRNDGRDRSVTQGTADLARASRLLLQALRDHPPPVEMTEHMIGRSVSLRMDAGA